MSVFDRYQETALTLTLRHIERPTSDLRYGSIATDAFSVGAEQCPVCSDSDHSRHQCELMLSVNFSREPPFILRELSYMRELPPERADSPPERIGGADGGGY